MSVADESGAQAPEEGKVAPVVIDIEGEYPREWREAIPAPPTEEPT